MANSQSVIAAFTELAARYEQTVDRELRQFWGITYQDAIARVLERVDIARAHTVLDVATGRGVIPVALIQHPAAPRRVVGVDITSAMLRGASAAVASQDPDRRISLVCGSGMQMPFAASAFDTAICALGVHHMRADVLLEEMRRVLRPGGQLVIIDVALANLFQTLPGRLLLRGLAQFYGRREGTARFEAEMEAVGNMLTPSQWRDLLVAAGFQDILLTIVPATRPWYPPGILASALSPEKQE